MIWFFIIGVCKKLVGNTIGSWLPERLWLTSTTLLSLNLTPTTVNCDQKCVLLFSEQRCLNQSTSLIVGESLRVWKSQDAFTIIFHIDIKPQSSLQSHEQKRLILVLRAFCCSDWIVHSLLILETNQSFENVCTCLMLTLERFLYSLH